MALPNEPTYLPKFAELDLIDPVTLQNNVVQPGTNLEDYGWYPFRVRPKRNFMNWLHRWTYRWLKHLKDDIVPQIETNVTDIGINVSDISDNATAIGNNASAIGDNASDIGDNASDITVLQSDVSDLEDMFESGSLSCVLDPGGQNFTVLGTGSSGAIVAGKIEFTGYWYRVGEVITISLPTAFGTLDGDASLTITGVFPADIKHNDSMRESLIVYNGGEKLPGYGFKQSSVSSLFLGFQKNVIQGSLNEFVIICDASEGDCGFDGFNMTYIRA